jgi:hypothetical protein
LISTPSPESNPAKSTSAAIRQNRATLKNVACYDSSANDFIGPIFG